MSFKGLNVNNSQVTSVDSVPTLGSENLVTSGGVASVLNGISTGKFYGFYANSSSLPSATGDGYAYVGSGTNSYQIYNIKNGVWSNSGSTVSPMRDIDEEDLTLNTSTNKIQFKNRTYGDGMGYKILRKNASFES